MNYPPLRSPEDILAMLDELTHARAKMLSACENVSADALLDPVIPGTWPVLRILGHVAWAEEYLVEVCRRRPVGLPFDRFPEPEFASLDPVRTALDESHAAAIAFLKAHPPEVLLEEVAFGRANNIETVGGIYFHIVEHEIHHRAFARYKLRVLAGR